MSSDAKKLIEEVKPRKAHLDKKRRDEERARLAADQLLFKHTVLIYKKKAALEVIQDQSNRTPGRSAYGAMGRVVAKYQSV